MRSPSSSVWPAIYSAASIEMSDCIFCDIVAGEAPASFVHRDELVSAFLDIRPVTPGHLLVIPDEHVVFTHDLPDATADRLFAVARRLARNLRQTDAVRADGINLFVADGEAAGQEVFHAHLHVIPRFPDDGFVVDAAAWADPPPTREELDALAATMTAPEPPDEKTRAWYRALPAKRVGAGVVFTDADGRVLLVRPTYKEDWEIPGGMVEASESPHAAAAREVSEELGIDRPAGRLLCVDWVPTRDPKTDGLMFLFDGGRLASADAAAIVLRSEELSEHQFVHADALDAFLPAHMARRVVAALAAQDAGVTQYLVDGTADDAQQPASRMFPSVSIETPRLLLRPYRAEDAPDVALACADELTQRWLPLPNPYTEADALAWCTEMAPGFRSSGEGTEWAAIRRSDGRLIGSFGLKRTDWRGRSSEVGYWVAPWARGEGLAVEATLAIARWLLVEQRFERMVLRAAIGNLASQRVAEKAGFSREGIARSAGFTNDGRVDLVVFSLIPSDLDRAQTRTL